MRFVEQEVIKNPNLISEYIRKLIKLNDIIGNDDYSIQLETLAKSIEQDSDMMHHFINSVENGGLYFEIASFADFDFVSVYLKLIEEEFNIQSNEEIIYPQKLYPYMAELTGNSDALIPNHDVHQQDVFCGPNYLLRLKHMAVSKNNCPRFRII